MSGTAVVARATRRTYAGLFVVTLTTLMYEVLLTRIFSATMWYHFAFAAVSIALFGMTVGALHVHLHPERFTAERTPEHLARFSLLFPLAIAGSFLVQLAVPFAEEWTFVTFFSMTLTYLVTAVPFVCSGIVVCLVLTKFPEHVSRLYAVDLVGAALGSVAFLLLLRVVDGVTGVLAVAALASVGAVLFARDLPAPRAARRPALAGLALLAVVVGNAVAVRLDAPIIRLVWAKGQVEGVHRDELWNAYSRVTIDGNPDRPDVPFGWGFSRRLPEDTQVRQLAMAIDGAAGTVLTRYDGDPEDVDFLRYDITNMGHYLRRDADVYVVGAGGGRDVLSALAFDQRSVTAVEINDQILEALNDRYGDFTGHLDRDPRVRFVNDEARSYLARSDDRYDMIQISLIDTWAASSAGAFALTENSLYTVDAWDTFLDRLDSGGILNVSRWYYPDRPMEAYRLVALANQTLRERGVDAPERHIAMVKTEPLYVPTGVGHVATILVSPDPFTPADLRVLERESRRLAFDVVVSPAGTPDDLFARLAGARSDAQLTDAVYEVPGNVAPPTDDQPFFFLMLDFRDLVNPDVYEAEYWFSNFARPVLVLAALAFAVVVLTLLCIAWPLRRVTTRAALRGSGPLVVFFAGIGLGFMLLEISQLQRLAIFLGHPTYALSVVLFSLLVASGIGSFLTERLARPDRPARMLAPLGLLLGAVVAFGLATPALIGRYEDATTPVRIAVAVGILVPLGIVMGMPFPIGMKLASQRSGAPTAFLWGVNGATSVCASVLAIALALQWGISRAFWAGGLAYLVAVGAFAYAALRRPAVAPAAEPGPPPSFRPARPRVAAERGSG